MGITFLPEIPLVFLILFFPGLFPQGGAQGVFSARGALIRLGLHTLPGLALIGFFLLKAENRPYRPSLKARPRDLATALLCLAFLCLIALAFKALSLVAPELPSPPGLVKPDSALSWTVLVLFYFASAYLEEAYFRVYLETALQRVKMAPLARLLISAGLFTLCHLYQGPLGLANALAAGIFLLLFYRKTRSPHGLALGHGLYNVLAYILA
jgi:membrane protease YdiL (CAAX protease family)